MRVVHGVFTLIMAIILFYEYKAGLPIHGFVLGWVVGCCGAFAVYYIVGYRMTRGED